jgi:hypothetical protein
VSFHQANLSRVRAQCVRTRNGDRPKRSSSAIAVNGRGRPVIPASSRRISSALCRKASCLAQARSAPTGTGDETWARIGPLSIPDPGEELRLQDDNRRHRPTREKGVERGSRRTRDSQATYHGAAMRAIRPRPGAAPGRRAAPRPDRASTSSRPRRSRRRNGPHSRSPRPWHGSPSDQ